MTTATITNTVVLPDGTTPPNMYVRIQLISSVGTPITSAYVTATGAFVDGLTEINSTNGQWTAVLQLNSGTNLTPSGTQYQVTHVVFNGPGHSLTYVDYISVTGSGTMSSMLTPGAPASLPAAGSQTYTDTQLASHVAALDPHTGYVLESLLDAKGDLYVGTADNTVGRLATGTNGQRLAVDPATSTGYRWDDNAVTYATTYGVRADGTDETTRVLAAVTACQATGGTLIWPNGTIRVDSQITIPNDGQATPKQRAMRWVGAAAWFSGRSIASAPYGGTILDLRYAGGTGCILTLGEGALEITGISFTQQGASPHTTPYLYTTNTTLLVHHNAFTGHASKTAATANQDAIVCGGTSTTTDGTITAPFQGYGTVIEKNWFNRISRGVYGRVYFNANVIRDNTFWAQCGGSCAIELDGTGAGGSPGNYAVGNVISGNLVEMVGYQYAVRLTYAEGTSVIHNNCYDLGASTVAGFKLDTEAVYNILISGWWDNSAGKPLYTEVSANNTIIDMAQSKPTRFRQPFYVDNTLTVSGQAQFTSSNVGPLLVQPSVAPTGGDNQVLLQTLRSAAEGANPGGTILQVTQGGQVWVGGNNAGSINILDQSGATVAQFASGLKTWRLAGSGGGMLIDSGTGGSNVDLKGFRLRVLSYADNSVQHQFGTTGIGFFGGAQASKQTVTGSRGGNAALASLLSALAAYGIITDSTTA